MGDFVTTYEKDLEALELVGIAEVAELLAVKAETVSTWRARGIFPEPVAVVSDRPAWRLATVLGWAESTGRLPTIRPANVMHAQVHEPGEYVNRLELR